MNTRTNIVLDDALIAQAMVKGGVTTKKAAVEAALKAYVHEPDYAALLALQGSGCIDPNYRLLADYPELDEPAARPRSAQTMIASARKPVAPRRRAIA